MDSDIYTLGTILVPIFLAYFMTKELSQTTELPRVLRPSIFGTSIAQVFEVRLTKFPTLCCTARQSFELGITVRFRESLDNQSNLEDQSRECESD